MIPPSRSSEPPVAATLAAAATWSLALAILFIVIGLAAILVPIVSGIAVALLAGWILAMAGVLHLLFAWQARGAETKLWELLAGLVYLVGGVYLLLHPLLGLTTLTLLVATYLLVKGVLEIIQYFQARPRRGLTPLVLDGIVNLVLAIIIWSQWPFSSVWVIGTLVGISILFSGVSRLMLSSEIRRNLPA
jgi:uncharacterized membrane protein HdeD (DUF308 family)